MLCQRRCRAAIIASALLLPLSCRPADRAAFCRQAAAAAVTSAAALSPPPPLQPVSRFLMPLPLLCRRCHCAAFLNTTLLWRRCRCHPAALLPPLCCRRLSCSAAAVAVLLPPHPPCRHRRRRRCRRRRRRRCHCRHHRCHRCPRHHRHCCRCRCRKVGQSGGRAVTMMWFAMMWTKNIYVGFYVFFSCPAFCFCWTDLDVRQTDIYFSEVCFLRFLCILGCQKLPRVAKNTP